MNQIQAAEPIKLDLITKELVRDFLKSKKGKPLTKNQMFFLLELMDHREQRAQLKGYQDGVAGEQKKHTGKEALRTEVAMTIQRLGDANAQIATSLARILEKL